MFERIARLDSDQGLRQIVQIFLLFGDISLFLFYIFRLALYLVEYFPAGLSRKDNKSLVIS